MKKKNMIYNILLIAGTAVFLTAASQLFFLFLEYQKGVNEYDSIAKSAVAEESNSTGQGNPRQENPRKEDALQKEAAWYDIKIDFDYLKNVNEDIIGWLRFDSNGIDYPIVQGEDNDEYLYTMADGIKNKCGSIFLESLNASDFSDSHTILYGHNMKDLSMFGRLKVYKSKDMYYEDNSFFTIYTKDAAYRYQIFAFYDVDETDRLYQVGFTADDVFEEFVDTMENRSYQMTGITADKKDKIMTLSTCSAEGKRFIVNAKRIDSRACID